MKFRYISAFVAALALALSCTAPSAQEGLPPMGENEGVLALNVGFGSRADESGSDVADGFKLRIYRHETDPEGNAVKGLVRKYGSIAEIPQYVWLMEGDYSVTVEAGVKSDASFTDRYFCGEQAFAIVAQQVANVDLDADMLNIPVEVRFDESITEKLTGAYAYVCTGTAFDIEAAKSASVPTLRYEQSATGYFILPEGCTDMCWYFRGEHAKAGVVERSGTISGVQPLTLYTLSFKYSKDAAGYLAISATLNTSADRREDNIPFSPDPVVKGEGFDWKQPYDYAGGERTYNVTALDVVTSLSIVCDGRTLDLLGQIHEGVKVVALSDKSYNITLSEPFFGVLTGGDKRIELYVSDANGGAGRTELLYRVQGVGTPPMNRFDLWENVGDIDATVFGTPEGIEIGYRQGGGEWSKFPASPSSADTYTARVKGVAAGRMYELALFIGGAQTGGSVSVSTLEGAQPMGADFENWSTSGGTVFPYSTVATAYWGTGNPGSSIANINLTNPSEDVRPGSKGRYSAYMKSAKATVMGVGKFAAGNIYIGEFLGLDGVNGKVHFGRPFDYDARPVAMKFWYKNYNGKINEGDKASGTDLTKIFICLCNWTAPHLVNTKTESTYFDPSEGQYDGILAYGYFTTQEHIADWTEKTIDLIYKDTTVKPNYLVITFTCSGYGDYFCGSTDSYMYLDDLELVY